MGTLHPKDANKQSRNGIYSGEKRLGSGFVSAGKAPPGEGGASQSVVKC